MKSTKPELLSKEEISPLTQSEFKPPAEKQSDTFTTAELLVEYLETAVISLELSYDALLEENGDPLIKIGKSNRYLKIVSESYNTFQLKSIKTSESVDPWVVETGDLLIVAQPIKASHALMLVYVSSIKNKLLEKMLELRKTIAELVRKLLRTQSERKET